jgi:hypothetical protein
LNVIAQDGSLWRALPRMGWAEYVKWTPKLIPAGKLGFGRSARCEKEQIDETKTQTV